MVHPQPSDLIRDCASMEKQGRDGRRLLSLVDEHKLKKILAHMLDETRFLGPYGIRSVSRYHAAHPYIFKVGGETYRLDYEPAESTSGLFGGNSNWRGPVWFPINFLLIETLQKFHHYLGDDFKVACPTGSGCDMTLWEVSGELSCRLIRPVSGRRRGTPSVLRRRSDGFTKILTGAISLSLMNIFTATTGWASGLRTRQDGPAWWQN